MIRVHEDIEMANADVLAEWRDLPDFISIRETTCSSPAGSLDGGAGLVDALPAVVVADEVWGQPDLEALGLDHWHQLPEAGLVAVGQVEGERLRQSDRSAFFFRTSSLADATAGPSAEDEGLPARTQGIAPPGPAPEV